MSHSGLAQRCVVLQKQQQLCVEPPPSALNVTLPAFAAESRRPHPRARIYRSISVADAGAQQQPAGRHCCCRSMGQTDGRTDARPLHRPCSICIAGSANEDAVCGRTRWAQKTCIRCRCTLAPPGKYDRPIRAQHRYAAL